MAMQAPPETLAYVAMLNPSGGPDALYTLDTRAGGGSYGQVVGRVDMTSAADELHHFGWNACSSCLCPFAAHPHVERRYLVVPGLKSPRVYVLDTEDDPQHPRILNVREPGAIAPRTGDSRPHTTHCGPDGVYINALGAPNGDGPGGIFTLDAETFEIRGPWEADRGPQRLAYDFWWHLGHDTMITSEWGTPNMVKDGVNPELLFAGKYGNALHVGDLKRRAHVQKLELGAEQQMVLELRPAHNPRRAYGFVGVVLSLADLSSSIWMWYRDKETGAWSTRKIIEIPAEMADPADLPPLLQGFKAVPPLVSDINLSLDDRFLYVSCWGTGELRQYDVSDPFQPKLAGSVRIGGIVGRVAHPSNQDKALNGGPQMVEVSRDGKRVYISNSLYTPWDAQFCPAGIRGWVAKLDVNPAGGIAFDPRFLVELDDGLRPHQVRLQGGDASSDSFCYS